MRTWTAAQNAAFALDATEIAFVVSANWASGIQYYTNRNFSPDFAGGITAKPILAKPPDCAREMNVSLDGVPLAGATTMELLNDLSDPDNIEFRLGSETTVVGVEVRVFAVFYGLADKDLVVAADWEDNPLGVYEITEVVAIEFDRVLFSLADRMETVGKALVCRTISRELTGDEVELPDNVWGQAIPIYLGSFPDAPAIPWGIGKSTRLDGGIDFDTLSFFVADLVGIEAGDTIFIDAEQLLVNSVIEGTSTTAPRIIIPVDGRGQNGTEAVEHSDGALIRKVLAETPFLQADRTLSKLGGVANPLPSAWEFKGKIAEKSVDVVAEERTLGGQTSTFMILPDGLPTIRESGSVEEVLLDGPSGNWTDSGNSSSSSYVKTGDPADWRTREDTAIGAVGETEDSHIEFALLDPPAGKILAAVVYDRDLVGRTALFKNLTLRCKFQMVPGENLPPTATDYPRDPWELVVRRDGLEIARGELGFPPLEVFRGLLDKTDFIPGIEPSRRLFAKTGFGSQFTPILRVANATLGATTIFNPPIGPDIVQVIDWPSYSRTPLSDGEVFRPGTDTGFTEFSVSETPRVTSGTFQSETLLLAPDFGPDIETVTKILLEVTVSNVRAGGRPEVPGGFRASVSFNDGRPLLTQTTTISVDDTDTITLELESDFVVLKDGSGDTVFGVDTITNLSFDTESVASGDTVVSDTFGTGATVAAVLGPDSLQISSLANETLTAPSGADIVVRSAAQYEGIPVSAIKHIRLGAFIQVAGSELAIEVADALVMKVDSARFTFWSTDGDKRVGEDEDLEMRETSIADALLMASSPSYEKSIRLTDHVRDGAIYETPYHFFEKPIEISVESAIPALASTRILITEFFLDLRERPWVERQLTDADLSEFPLLVDTEGELADDLIAGSGTILPESPPNAIFWCLKKIWGLSDSEIISADVPGGLLRATADREWWKFARRIDDPTLQKKAFLSGLCRDAAIRPIKDGAPFRFVPIGDSGAPSVASIGMNEIKGRPTKELSPESMTVNQWGVFFRRKAFGDRNFLGRHEANDTGSQSTAMGVRRDTVDLENVRDTPTAVAWGLEALKETANSRLMLGRFTVPWSQGRVNVGDTVDLTHDYANLSGMPGVVAGIRQASEDEIALSVWTPGFRVRVWTAISDPTTYIEVLPALGLMVFVFEGAVIANLTRDAMWILKGRTNPVKTVPGTQTEFIEKTVGSIQFGIDFGGASRNTEMELTSAGDLTLFGTGSFAGKFFAKRAWPVLSSHTLYIEEKFAGGAPAVLSFSVDLENQQAKLAGGITAIAGLTSRKYSHDSDL